MKRVGLLVTSIVALALLAPASAFGVQVNRNTDQADLTPDNGICDVDTTDVDQDCTLRAAIQTAQGTSNPGSDTINFSLTLPATINVTALTELDIIDEGLTITGPGASQLTVDGQNSVDWIFNVNAPAATSVQISGITITHGSHNGSSVAQASGVRNQSGTMLLDHVVVTANSASSGALNALTQGGGIFNTGTMVIRDSTVSNNGGGASGGDNSPPSNPTSITRGGGIYNQTDPGESLLIERSTVSGNLATATIVDGTGAGTSAIGRGGGIHNVGGSTLTLDRVTVSGNTASAFIGGGAAGTSVARGGGIDDDNTTVGALIRSSTVTANVVSATGNGPATLAPSGANLKPTAVTAIHNTIISLPVGATSCEVVGGVSSYSIESPGNTCGLGGTGDQVTVANSALMLDPNLVSNGGPAQTHKLLPGSLALDKGKAQGETSDQRGQPRPSQFTYLDASGGDGSDVGAYEVRAPLPQFTSIDPGPSGSDDTPTLHGIVPDDGSNPSDSDIALFTDPGCNTFTGTPSPESVFATPGIAASPVVHNATTTFHANGENLYGTSLCSSGPFPGTITYTHQDAPTTPLAQPPTGLRAAALKKCKKKRTKPARRKCRKKALTLPV